MGIGEGALPASLKKVAALRRATIWLASWVRVWLVIGLGLCF